MIGDNILFKLRTGGKRIGKIENYDYLPIGQSYIVNVIASDNKGILRGTILSPYDELIIGKVVGNRIVN